MIQYCQNYLRHNLYIGTSVTSHCLTFGTSWKPSATVCALGGSTGLKIVPSVRWGPADVNKRCVVTPKVSPH